MVLSIIAAVLVATTVVWFTIAIWIVNWEWSGFDGEENAPSPAANTVLRRPEGSKPCSFDLSGVVYRYSAREHLKGGDQFWRNFEDGPWKWDTANRYAGRGLNPGHFFGAFPGTARREFAHYLQGSIDQGRYQLLSVEGCIKDVMDLTQIETIRWLREELKILNDEYDLMGQLVTASTGGTYFTDLFGSYAYERDYGGILFFSARNIEDSDREDLQSETYYTEHDALTFKSYTWSAMWAEPENRCLVIFRGAELVRNVRRFRIDQAAWEDNHDFAKPAEEILAKSECFGKDYQAMRIKGRGCSRLTWGDRRRCLRCAAAEDATR
jgi:hypothetical protein